MKRMRIFQWMAVLLMVAIFAGGVDSRSIARAAAQGGRRAFSTAPQLDAPPTQAELTMMIEKSKSALTFLNQFWASQFNGMRRSFRAPAVKILQSGEAFYQSQDHTIYFNPAFFVSMMRKVAKETHTDGDMAFISVLAHEYGHSIQAQLGLLKGDCLNVELQADRMTGAFARAAKERGLIEPGDFDEATLAFFIARDETDKFYACAHGSGTQRVEAFHSGLKDGLKAVFGK